MEKKKLLIFHPTIAVYRVDFFNRLCEAFITRVCLQFWNLKEQKFDYCKIYNQFSFTPVYLPEGSCFKTILSVWKNISDYEPDIVLTPEYGIYTIIALFKNLFCHKRYKVVVISDDSLDMIEGENDFTLRHRFARNIMAKIVDDVIVVSPIVKKWYKNNFNKGLYFPIIVDDIKAEENYKRLLPLSREYVNRYCLKGKKVLLSVSRLVDLKNLYRVIDAFGQSIIDDSVLVIVGDGPEREGLEKHSKSIKKEVLIVGRFEGDELYAWYNLASVFILASYKEPFGAVTNEALLAGCRVVISEKAGSSCLVNIDNGELVNPYDIQSISTAIDNQLSKAQIPDTLYPRHSLMDVTFDELYKQLIDNLYEL